MNNKEPIFILVLLLSLCSLGVSGSLQTQPFNYTLTYDQLMLSYAAYCPASQLQNWSCIWCNNNTDVGRFRLVATVYNATTNIFGYVGYTGTIGQVVFRGTHFSSLLNWIDDLNIAHAVPYPSIPGAFVHSGFLDSWRSVRSQIELGIKMVYDVITPTEFYFSGHSLGAAISVLAALEVGALLPVPIICYNFGDPRVGNTEFAHYFNEQIDTTYRMVNQHDIVPHLPTKTLGFWHIATEVWWNTTTTYRVCDDSGEDPSCSDSILVSLSIPDHLSYLGIHLAVGHQYGCE